MTLWKSLSGIMRCELTSAEPEAAMAAISAENISLYQLKQIDLLTYSFSFLRKDFKSIRSLCLKRGDKLKIVEAQGLYFSMRSLLQRPVLLIGLVFLLTMTLLLPTRVLFVKVEGNQRIPTNKILAAGEEAGIAFGASRREIRSEKVKNRLLSAVPELQWAGINTRGCIAVISVRERQAETSRNSEETYVSNIVSARDGYILSATATKGNLMVHPGQAVTEGQVLISGYTDCGLSIQAARAEGEIIAQTNREFQAVAPAFWIHRTESTGFHRSYSLLLGKKRIKIWKDSGNVSPVCDRMYEEYYVTLPGGFSLPLAVCVETVRSCETIPLEQDSAAAQQGLSGFAREYLIENMVAGRILEEKQDFSSGDGIYIFSGRYLCSEMIGRVQHAKIGDYNGESG